MQQPSAQGIASLFRGNPAPLQQRIQQEQQAKPGLPQDLQKLMALNIVTNEKDAMAKQQALSQLAQMQGPQGKPPTVLETVQEQARQKMQAQQVQAQQQQQAMQAMAKQAGPGPVPEGTQFAEAQPQGIDELPVEFEMAGGGIVAFQSRGSVPEAEPASDSMGGFTSDPVREALNALRIEEKYAEANREKRLTELREKAAFLTEAGAPQAGAAVAALEAEERKGRKREEAPKQEVYDPAQETRRSQYEGGIRELVDRPAPPAPKTPRPAPSIAMPTMPTAQPAAPVEKSKAALMQESFLEKSPENERIAAMERMKAMIKEPDTTQRDAMIKQLQAERDRQVGPQDSYGQLMEYLGQIAATPRGLSSFGAGAAGVRGVNALEEQRAQKRFELGSKIIEQEQGKINDSRAFAKDMFNVGEKEYDQILKTQFEAAKQITSNEMEALKIAKQEALKIMEMRQNAQIENRKIDAQANRDVDSRLLQGYIDAYGGDVVKAHQAMAKAKGESKPDAYSVELMKKIADAEVAAAGMPGKIGEQKRAELAVLKRQAGIAGGAPTGGGGVPLPSNASAANLNVGTVYQTARGPAKWTGTGFTPI
jgi:hypothetical protein